MSKEDGNDRRVYVGNLPPDIRSKVKSRTFLNRNMGLNMCYFNELNAIS